MQNSLLGRSYGQNEIESELYSLKSNFDTYDEEKLIDIVSNHLIEGKTILYWSDIFTKLSKEGLKNRNQLNSKKNNETIYLKNIDSMIVKKSTKAEESVKNLKK